MRKQTYRLNYENAYNITKAIYAQLGYNYTTSITQDFKTYHLQINIIQARLPMIEVITRGRGYKSQACILSINKQDVYGFVLVTDAGMEIFRHEENLDEYINTLNGFIDKFNNLTYYLKCTLEMQKVIESTANDLNVQPEIFP